MYGLPAPAPCDRRRPRRFEGGETIYIYIYIYREREREILFVFVYIYIYIERESKRDILTNNDKRDTYNMMYYTIPYYTIMLHDHAMCYSIVYHSKLHCRFEDGEQGAGTSARLAVVD